MQAECNQQTERATFLQENYGALNSSSNGIAVLWLETLKFYSIQFAIEKECVSIMEQDVLKKEKKPWPRSKKLTIEGKNNYLNLLHESFFRLT